MIYFMFLLFFTNFGDSNRQAKKVWQITKITIIARMCRKNMAGVNGYEFVRPDGISHFIRAEMAVIQKMAKRI